MSPRRHADERGLVSLEWLLIVAASIAMAATTVVATGKVVTDGATSAHKSDSTRAAAQAALEVVLEADRNDFEQPDIATTWAGWETYYTMKCEQIGRDFATAGITVVPGFDVVPTKADSPVKSFKIVTHDGIVVVEEDRARYADKYAEFFNPKFQGIHGLDMLQPAPKMAIIHSDTAGNPIPKGTYKGFEIFFPLAPHDEPSEMEVAAIAHCQVIPPQ